MRQLIPILLILTSALGCDDVPTQTVSRCYPDDGACEEFLGARANVVANAEVGQQVFKDRCSRCHGVDGMGMGFVDRADFTSPGWQRRWSDSELGGIITAGRGMKMPGARLPPLELKSVVSHIRSFDTQRGKSDAPIAPKEGQGPKIYDDKAMPE